MKCKICGTATEAKIYKVREMMYGFRDVHDYFQCENCQCLQIIDFPKNIQNYYVDYYSYNLSKPKAGINKLATKLRDKYALFGKGFLGKLIYSRYPSVRLNYLKPLIASINVNWHVLDVGCGSGQVLLELQSAGFKNLTGTDPFINCGRNYGNGVVIKKADIHELNDEFDLIMFHHSLEHIPDQLKTLQKAFSLLKPGGHCIIRIPTVSSYAWKYYGVDWAQLDAPRHFFLHSVESVRLLSDLAGFKLDDVVYDSDSFQFWVSEQYQNDIPLKDSRSYGVNPTNSLFSANAISDYEKKSIELNLAKQGDQAIFYLRKPL